MQRLTNYKPRAVGNLLVMVMFATLGLVEIMDRDFLLASIWLSLAVALASLGPEDRKWSAIPLRRRIIGQALLALGAALFAYQVIIDIAA